MITNSVTVDDKSYTYHHNGDYSGEVIFTESIPGGYFGEEIKVPFRLMEEIVGRKYISDRVEQVEQMTGREYLRGSRKA